MRGAKKWKALLVAALVTAGIGTAFALPASPKGESSGALSAIRNAVTRNNDADADDQGDDRGGTSAMPRAETDDANGGARPKPPKVKDVPAPPAAGPTAGHKWDEYLAETKAVVETDKTDLTAAISEVTAALSGGDTTALAEMLAPDEGDQDAYLAGLADKYPTILESAPAGNVNIFTSDGATIYFGYSIVTWTDAGIVSQHTIPIMLRRVNDQWYITSLGDIGGDLQFVQSVTL